MISRMGQDGNAPMYCGITNAPLEIPKNTISWPPRPFYAASHTYVQGANALLGIVACILCICGVVWIRFARNIHMGQEVTKQLSDSFPLHNYRDGAFKILGKESKSIIPPPFMAPKRLSSSRKESATAHLFCR